LKWVIGYWLLIVGCWLLALQQTTNNKQLMSACRNEVSDPDQRLGPLAKGFQLR